MSGIVESLHNAVNAGLHVKQDWVDMGFGIADTVAKIVESSLVLNTIKQGWDTFVSLPCFIVFVDAN